MMQRLDFDFNKPVGKQGGWAGWLLLLVGILLLVEMGYSYVHQQDLRDIAAQKPDLSAAQQNNNIAQQYSERDLETAKVIMTKLATPWDEFFAGLESINNRNVAILSAVPDLKNNSFQIEGEAKDYAAVLTLVSQLKSNQAFKEVYLLSHAVKQDDPLHPITFAISMHGGQRL